MRLFDESDDGAAGGVRSDVNEETLAHWIAIRPENAGHSLAHGDDGWRIGAIGGCEAAAPDDARAHCPEEIRRTGLQGEIAQRGNLVRPLLVRGQRVSLESPERNARGRRGSDSPGQPPGGFRQLALQLDPGRPRRSLIASAVFADNNDWLDVVPEMQPARVLETSHEEPGADQERDRQRQLGGEQPRYCPRCATYGETTASAERRPETRATRVQNRRHADQERRRHRRHQNDADGSDFDDVERPRISRHETLPDEETDPLGNEQRATTASKRQNRRLDE